MLNSKRKGCAGERELARVLESYGFSAHRGQQFKGGADSPDVICESMPDIHIECKRVEHLNLYQAMEQAARDCGGKAPAVFHRKNRKPWMVTMLLDDWVEIYRKGRE